MTVALPGGEVCLKKLALAGVDFRPLDEIRGIETPIRIENSIGGIRYHSGFGPMVSDCRFALALATAAPDLTALGVSEMHFSGAYSYRTSRVGRLSLHAYGLALDVHEIVIDGRRMSVERDFVRGIGCRVGPALNRVACRLRELGIFRELLTPDYNADHNNHFHLGVAPLGPLANELWAKRPVRHPSPQLPVFGNGSRTIRASSDLATSAAERPAKQERHSKHESVAKAGPESAGPKVTDRRQARKRRDTAPAAKSKREQVESDSATKKARNARAEPKPKSVERERKAQADEHDDKPAAKARKRKRVATPDKRKKSDRAKAAKRSNARDKDGAS